MSEETDKRAVQHLHKAMDEATSLAGFIVQFESLTNNQLTGGVEALTKIKEHIYDAIVDIAAGGIK